MMRSGELLSIPSGSSACLGWTDSEGAGTFGIWCTRREIPNVPVPKHQQPGFRFDSLARSDISGDGRNDEPGSCCGQERKNSTQPGRSHAPYEGSSQKGGNSSIDVEESCQHEAGTQPKRPDPDRRHKEQEAKYEGRCCDCDRCGVDEAPIIGGPSYTHHCRLGFGRHCCITVAADSPIIRRDSFREL